MAVKRGLGRGIDSLIPDNNKSSKSKEIANTGTTTGKKASSAGQLTVKITEVEPNRDQPRKTFNEDRLQELAESIKQHGIIEPLVVVKRKDYYEIVAGERRWRAAMIAGLKEVPIIVRNYTEEQIVEIALIENLQREDLNPIEEAKAYQQLIGDFNLKQDEVADKVSKSRTTITNSLRLLKLDEQVQQMIIEDYISSGHARALLSLEDNDRQLEVANMIIDMKLSVRDTEKLIRKMKKAGNVNSDDAKDKVKLENAALFEDYEEKLKCRLESKVTINRKNNTKGKIEIEYYSNEEFERIYSILMK